MVIPVSRPWFDALNQVYRLETESVRFAVVVPFWKDSTTTQRPLIYETDLYPLVSPTMKPGDAKGFHCLRRPQFASERSASGRVQGHWDYILTGSMMDINRYQQGQIQSQSKTHTINHPNWGNNLWQLCNDGGARVINDWWIDGGGKHHG